MKQIGLALHNYHTTMGSFPPGGLITSVKPGSTTYDRAWSTHAFLLPDIEQVALYNAANFMINPMNQNPGSYINLTVCITRVQAFLCPSAPWPSWLCLQDSAAVNSIAPGNCYFASYGASIEWYWADAGGPPNGIFNVTGPVLGLSGITDGSSNTIAFGEWKVGSGNTSIISQSSDVIFLGSGPSGTSRTVAGTEVMPAMYSLGFQAWITQCAQSIATVRATETPNLGESWAWGMPAYSLGTTLLPPNSPYPNCNGGTANTLDSAGMYNMSSFHPGGANMLMADGSVHFLKNSVSMQIVWALGSCAQGEIISSDSY